MKILFLSFFLAVTLTVLVFASLDSDEALAIIDKVDANIHFSSIIYRGQLSIKRGSNEIKKAMLGWANGEEFYLVFTNIEDKGVKYLRKSGNLYVYFPDADDIMTISKSMLRQDFMGSDISYDDVTKNRKLKDDYEVETFETVAEDGRKYHVIKLKAVKKDVSYFRQMLKIDAELFIAVETKLYDLSGRLVKTIRLEKYEKFQDRVYPVKTSVINGYKNTYSTTFEIFDVKFNVTIDPQIFTIKYLYKQ